MRFAFDLALALGRANPYEMLAEMPNWLMSEWKAYSQFEPIQQTKRIEMMVAKMMALMVNINRKAGKQPISPAEFMPKYGPPKPTRPVESGALYRAFRDWAVLAGAKKE